MSAVYPERRKYTARELGKRFNRSPRTIQRVMAEPRTEYLAGAARRREQIRELRTTGLSYRAIAAEVGCSIGTVHNALKDATV